MWTLDGWESCWSRSTSCKYTNGSYTYDWYFSSGVQMLVLLLHLATIPQIPQSSQWLLPCWNLHTTPTPHRVSHIMYKWKRPNLNTALNRAVFEWMSLEPVLLPLAWTADCIHQSEWTHSSWLVCSLTTSLWTVTGMSFRSTHPWPLNPEGSQKVLLLYIPQKQFHRTGETRWQPDADNHWVRVCSKCT